MVNYNSPVVQDMVQRGSLDNTYNIFTPDPPVQNTGYLQPYNPNMDYYRAAPQQLNSTTTYVPIYNNPYLPGQQMQPSNTFPLQQGYTQNMNYQPQPYSYGYGQQSQLNNYYQQPRQPWQLMQPSNNYYSQYGGDRNPFVSSPGPGYGPNYMGNNQPQYSYVIPGFNPTGATEMYSAELNKKMAALEEKYNKLNAEKIAERKRQYSGFGYNYYGMLNNNYVDPILNSEYNREKAAIEAEAKETLMNFNLRLSRAAHYYLGDKDLDDEEEIAKMKKVYSNTVVTIPKPDMDNYYLCRSLERGIDITEAAKRSAQAADRKVSEYFHKIVNPNADIDEFLDTAGLILWEASMEELNKKGATLNERYNYEKLQKELQRNIDIRDGVAPSIDDIKPYRDPTAPFSAMERLGILDDNRGVSLDMDTGTIHLDRNAWAANRQIQQNREQMDYEAQRRAFIESVYNPAVV